MEIRAFDEFEKGVIRTINRGNFYSRNVEIILDNFLEKTCITIDLINKKASYWFEIRQATNPTKDELEWIVKKEQELTEIVIRLITLLKYLEEEKLVTFFAAVRNNNPHITFGRGAENLPYLSMDINDQAIVELLISYTHKEIMPSPSLKILEIHNFQSWDEIKFKKQYVATWIAISLSLIIGIGGLINNYTLIALAPRM